MNMSPTMTNMRLLLQTLRLRLPGVRVHIRLADEDPNVLVVGLVAAAGTPEVRFYDAALEEKDLGVYAPIVAAEIVWLYEAHEESLAAAPTPRTGTAPTATEPTNPPPIPPGK